MSDRTRRERLPPATKTSFTTFDFTMLSAPEAIRTPDLQLRRLSLYPAELRAQLALTDQL